MVRQVRARQRRLNVINWPGPSRVTRSKNRSGSRPSGASCRLDWRATTATETFFICIGPICSSRSCFQRASAIPDSVAIVTAPPAAVASGRWRIASAYRTRPSRQRCQGSAAASRTIAGSRQQTVRPSAPSARCPRRRRRPGPGATRFVWRDSQWCTAGSPARPGQSAPGSALVNESGWHDGGQHVVGRKRAKICSVQPHNERSGHAGRRRQCRPCDGWRTDLPRQVIGDGRVARTGVDDHPRPVAVVQRDWDDDFAPRRLSSSFVTERFAADVATAAPDAGETKHQDRTDSSKSSHGRHTDVIEMLHPCCRPLTRHNMPLAATPSV